MEGNWRKRETVLARYRMTPLAQFKWARVDEELNWPRAIAAYVISGRVHIARYVRQLTRR